MKGSEKRTIDLPPRFDQISRASVFVAVARSASFSGAASALGMARSTVSEQVRQLEEAVGAKLLERTTRRVRLTEEGALLLEHMEVVHKAWRDAQDAFDARRSEPSGHLRITAPSGFSRSLVGPALADVLNAHPGVSAELLVDDTIRDLVSEGIDLALRAAPLEDTGLVARSLGSMPVKLVAAPRLAHVLESDVGGLQDASWISHSAVASTEVHLRRPGQHGVVRLRIGRRILASTGAGQIALLVNGCGIAAMPWWLVADEVRRGTLVTTDAWVGRTLPLYAIYPARRLLPARTRLLIDRIVERLPTFLPQK